MLISINGGNLVTEPAVIRKLKETKIKMVKDNTCLWNYMQYSTTYTFVPDTKRYKQEQLKNNNMISKLSKNYGDKM